MVVVKVEKSNRVAARVEAFAAVVVESLTVST